MMTHLSWIREKTPKSLLYDDVYFQPLNGVEESQWVYLKQSGFLDSISQTQKQSVAELGFGTGLNFQLTKNAFLKNSNSHQNLAYFAFEKHPLSKSQLKEFYQKWDFDSAELDWLQTWEPNQQVFHWKSKDQKIELNIFFGDANQRIFDLINAVHSQKIKPMDYWYFDGFNPSKNPDLWSETLFQNIAKTCKVGTRFSTFTSASFVQKNLRKTGFEVQKAQGFLKKREQICGYFHGDKVQSKYRYKHAFENLKSKNVVVVGAGISGCQLSYALSKKGYQVTLIDQNPSIACGSSGNPSALVKPLIRDSKEPLSQFSIEAFEVFQQILSEVDPNQESVISKGNLDFSRDESHRIRLEKNLRNSEISSKLLRWIDSSETLNLSKNIEKPAAYSESAFVIQPKVFCEKLVEACGSNLNLKLGKKLEKIEFLECGDWKLSLSGEWIESKILVLACSTSVFSLVNIPGGRFIRGEILEVDDDIKNQSNLSLSAESYIYPTRKIQRKIIGSTYERIQSVDEPFDESWHRNKILSKIEKDFDWEVDASTIKNHFYSTRVATEDYFPIAGPVLDESKSDSSPCYIPGLFVMSGLSSRGMNDSGKVAQICSDMFSNQVKDTDNQWIERILPNRLFYRNSHRSESKFQTRKTKIPRSLDQNHIEHQ